MTANAGRDDGSTSDTLARVDAAAILSMARVASLRELNSPGEPDLFHEVAILFAEDLPMRLAALRSACAARDSTGVLSSAHAIKGSARNVGADRLAVLMEQFEDVARGDRTEAFPALLERLPTVAEATRTALLEA